MKKTILQTKDNIFKKSICKSCGNLENGDIVMVDKNNHCLECGREFNGEIRINNKTKMTQAELFQEIEIRQSYGLDIIKKKNCDYGATEDCFANFRMFGELGFLVRMGDKLSRLKTIISRGDCKVNDESVEDTLVDLANYCYLLLAYRKEKNGK